VKNHSLQQDIFEAILYFVQKEGKKVLFTTKTITILAQDKKEAYLKSLKTASDILDKYNYKNKSLPQKEYLGISSLINKHAQGTSTTVNEWIGNEEELFETKHVLRINNLEIQKDLSNSLDLLAVD